MANYIPDFTKSRWMVSNPKRLVRTGMDGKPFRCPFCEGNEADTPPETYRIGQGEKDKIDWQVRVVPNLFPITDIHEVIIHSPGHEKNIEDFELVQVENIIKTYIDRYNFFKDKGKVFIFHNYSLASGASLIHPHSQISIVPNDVQTNTLALQPIVNIVEQVNDFVSYCPDYSEWSYEVWIAPYNVERITCNFENLNQIQISNLAKILQSSIRKLKKIHAGNPHYTKKSFGYNFYIFIPQERFLDSSLRSSLEMTREGKTVIPTEVEESSKWYLRIIPRFMERAGFELSTGIMVNSVEPKKAAEELKKS